MRPQTKKEGASPCIRGGSNNERINWEMRRVEKKATEKEEDGKKWGTEAGKRMRRGRWQTYLSGGKMFR